MHIAFLLRLWPVYGGGETVTLILANELVKRGYEVSVVYFKENVREVLPFVDERVKTVRIPDVCCDAYRDGVEDVRYVSGKLCRLVEDRQIDILVNQWWPVEFIKEVGIKTGVRVIKCLHLAFYTQRHIEGWGVKSILKRCLYPLYRFCERKRSLRTVTDFLPYCDKYVFLSPLFLEQFKKMAGFTDRRQQLDYVYNPLTFPNFIASSEIEQKDKEVLFVGRLEESHKKVSRILRSWALVQATGKYADWKLTIVGEGRDRDNYKTLAAKLSLKHVAFEGQRDPLPYYRRASVLVMTSAVEGWGMVLLEAMQMGVVPVVMDTYLSLHDIIVDNKNGLIAPDADVEIFTQKLISLMEDRNLRERLANDGIESCRKFQVENIVDKWEAVFKTI